MGQKELKNRICLGQTPRHQNTRSTICSPLATQSSGRACGAPNTSREGAAPHSHLSKTDGEVIDEDEVMADGRGETEGKVATEMEEIVQVGDLLPFEYQLDVAGLGPAYKIQLQNMVG
ncbi:BQ5605_C006g04278 [Microbotryum silenes-dioicae]|uniref:BQ5605_C006g04278 protein n=1 Tax=Microbotryum silenes-dioicae TaxID=796604 RepID=A0A2X0MTM4_9BASI|nr:BQ5605_C006g04278 [Microbotryum silenes-dioicae]